MKITSKNEANLGNKGRKSAQILGIPLDSTSKERLLSLVQSSLKGSGKFIIVTPNPEIILRAQEDKELKNILENADYSLPDGIGLIWAGRLLDTAKDLELIKGRDFLLSLFELADSNRMKVFLLGSTKEVIEKSIKRVKSDYSNIKVEGFEGPFISTEGLPVSEKDTNLQIDTFKRINAFKPDLLIVAFGAPKQEKWLGNNLDKLSIKGAMVVGGSLDYFAGVKRTPPNLIDQLNLEWLWRMFMEKGHWKRVYKAVVVFPLLVLKEKFLK